MSETMEWQPIETAPKDGEPLLALSVNDAYPPLRAIVSWGCVTHMFSSRHQCKRYPSDDCKFEWNGEVGTRFGVPFTHWMPLPSPPSGSVVSQARGDK